MFIKIQHQLFLSYLDLAEDTPWIWTEALLQLY